MAEASSSNLELSIVLPLGVIASQLQRIEAQLRQLNMKASSFAKEGENDRLTALIETRLDDINEALDSIRRLVSDMETVNRKPHPDRDD